MIISRLTGGREILILAESMQNSCQLKWGQNPQSKTHNGPSLVTMENSVPEQTSRQAKGKFRCPSHNSVITTACHRWTTLGKEAKRHLLPRLAERHWGAHGQRFPHSNSASPCSAANRSLRADRRQCTRTWVLPGHSYGYNICREVCYANQASPDSSLEPEGRQFALLEAWPEHYNCN